MSSGFHAPLFSVIIPTHDRPEMLCEAIDSVLSQTVEDFECIVVDDGGSIRAELPDDPRMLLRRHEQPRGQAAAINTGIRMARGRYIAFLDDDDLYTSERLAIALEGHQDAPVTICRKRGTDGTTGGNRMLKGDVYDQILDALTPNLGQVSVEATTIPFFDERFLASQDLEWWLRLARVAKVITIDRIGFIYRVHHGARGINGTAARIRFSRMLLTMRSEYFVAHPRAAAFRHERIGFMAQDLDDRSLARASFWRSVRLYPRPRTLWHAVRALQPRPVNRPSSV
jgi:glycosyltransferase involved in cell wall biosynthesis